MGVFFPFFFTLSAISLSLVFLKSQSSFYQSRSRETRFRGLLGPVGLIVALGRRQAHRGILGSDPIIVGRAASAATRKNRQGQSPVAPIASLGHRVLLPATPQRPGKSSTKDFSIHAVSRPTVDKVCNAPILIQSLRFTPKNPFSCRSFVIDLDPSVPSKHYCKRYNVRRMSV